MTHAWPWPGPTRWNLHPHCLDPSHATLMSGSGNHQGTFHHNITQETLMTLNFLKVIRNSSLKLLFLDFKLSLIFDLNILNLQRGYSIWLFNKIFCIYTFLSFKMSKQILSAEIFKLSKREPPPAGPLKV